MEAKTNKSSVIEITLTPEQRRFAIKVGKQRTTFNKKVLGKKDSYGFKGNPEKIDILGAISEYSASIALEVKWSGFCEDYEKLTGDIGNNIQVRSTKYAYGNLLLHPKDKDDDIFILVRAHLYPLMQICGWIKGKQGKNKEFWEDGTNYKAFKGRPCFRFPAKYLNNIGTLIKKVK